MYGYIYETTNLINGKKYIGQHRSNKFEPNKYIGSGKLLLKAIEKYGKENFSCALLEECNSRDELNKAEKKWIEKFKADSDRENYYNVSRGGEGHTCNPWNKGKHGVQEWTDAMEAAFEKGRHLPASQKQRDTLSQIRTGINVSDETRTKLSNAQKGKICINNGFINTYIDHELYEYYYNQGWQKGLDKSLNRTKERQAKRDSYKNSKRFND